MPKRWDETMNEMLRSMLNRLLKKSALGPVRGT